MAMLVFHAADHLRHFVEGAEGGRPVGDGQAGVIASDERSGDDQDEGGAGGEDREAVQSAMVRHFDALQVSPLWLLVEGRASRSAGCRAGRARRPSLHRMTYRGISLTEDWRNSFSPPKTGQAAYLREHWLLRRSRFLRFHRLNNTVGELRG